MSYINSRLMIYGILLLTCVVVWACIFRLNHEAKTIHGWISGMDDHFMPNIQAWREGVLKAPEHAKNEVGFIHEAQMKSMLKFRLGLMQRW